MMTKQLSKFPKFDEIVEKYNYIFSFTFNFTTLYLKQNLILLETNDKIKQSSF